MQRAHKIRMRPTKRQIDFFKKSVGVSRFVWNWALAEWNDWYSKGGRPSGNELKRYFNSIKNEKFPFVTEVSKWGPERVFLNLDTAFKRFRNKTSKHPRFKKRGTRESYRVDGSVVKVHGVHITLPKVGRVRLTEPLRFEGKIVSVTISTKGGYWFVSVNMEVTDTIGRKADTRKPSGSVGIDLGINSFATLSNGEKTENPRIFEKFARRLRQAARQFSRKQPKSMNRDKSRLRLARVHYRMECARNDFLHKFTFSIANRFALVYVENLNVRGMIRNKHLARHISDLGWGEALRQLSYKCQTLIKRDRFFPSSQLCSNCGYQQKLSLSERVYTCPTCGLQIDRDVNAARNLHTDGLSGINARGDGSSGRSLWTDETAVDEAGTTVRNQSY